MSKSFLIGLAGLFFSNIDCARLFSEHPAKKPMQKHRQENVWTCDLFLALEWQINDKIKSMAHELDNSEELITIEDFRQCIIDYHTTAKSIVDSILTQELITLDKNTLSFQATNGRNLTIQDSFLGKLACEVQRAHNAVLSRLAKINGPTIDKAGLITFLKFHKNIMSNFWRSISKTAMSMCSRPGSEFLNDSILKLDYDHNKTLDSDTKASRAQAKERYTNFVRQELPFLALELDTCLKDDFLDHTKNHSARAMASFFASTIKLVSILSPVSTSIVLETPIEHYDKLCQTLIKLLGEFNKRFARISRFPSYDSCAKLVLWKLAYWTYNIMPYKDCSFSDQNEYTILDLFWQSCKNLGKPFQISTQKTSWPNHT